MLDENARISRPPEGVQNNTQQRDPNRNTTNAGHKRTIICVSLFGGHDMTCYER